MDDLTFHMGKFPAELPGDLRYAATNHMWCRAVEGRWRLLAVRREHRVGARRTRTLPEQPPVAFVR